MGNTGLVRSLEALGLSLGGGEGVKWGRSASLVSDPQMPVVRLRPCFRNAGI